MSMRAIPRGANPLDAGGVEADEHGIRRYTDLHPSLIEMLRESVERDPRHALGATIRR